MIAVYYSQELNTGGVVYSYTGLHYATFCPTEWDIVILDRIKGGTYAEKKAQVRDLAVQYAWINEVPMAWSNLANIGAWFEKYGRRYGLLEEFRENGIC